MRERAGAGEWEAVAGRARALSSHYNCCRLASTGTTHCKPCGSAVPCRFATCHLRPDRDLTAACCGRKCCEYRLCWRFNENELCCACAEQYITGSPCWLSGLPSGMLVALPECVRTCPAVQPHSAKYEPPDLQPDTGHLTPAMLVKRSSGFQAKCSGQCGISCHVGCVRVTVRPS